MRWFLALATFVMAGMPCLCAQDVDHPLHIGGEVKAPVLLNQVDPDLSKVPEKERRFGQGFSAYLVVDQDGQPQHMRITSRVRPEMKKAIFEALRTYRFRPATRNGTPVAVDLLIEVQVDSF